MKACGYCGQENDDAVERCSVCGKDAFDLPPCDLPVTPAEKSWIEDSFRWLICEFGTEDFLKRRTVLPERSFFPDSYKGTDTCVEALVARVCSYMGVDASSIEIYHLEKNEDLSAKHRTGVSESEHGVAGLYQHPTAEQPNPTIFIRVDLRKEPMNLVATVAHELGHVILLGGGRISRDHESHELLTDLITVFFGLGIFTANSAFSFSQWQDYSHQGWKTSRMGYMSEEQFGYALACYAWLRSEPKPDWAKHLSINIRTYFKESMSYLTKGGQTTLQGLRG